MNASARIGAKGAKPRCAIWRTLFAKESRSFFRRRNNEKLYRGGVVLIAFVMGGTVGGLWAGGTQ